MSTEDVSRRALLRTAGGTAAAAGVAAGAAGSAAAQEEVPVWPSSVEGNVNSYTDARGQDEVTISVGAGDGLAFDPTKVWIDPGTTIVWEWTGNGGDHNVHAVDGPASFESEITGEEGFTFEYETSEEDAGITHYQCDPHSQVGMHGGIAVGGDIETESTGGGDSASGVVFVPEGAKALGIATFIAMVSTLGMAFFFLRYGGDGGGE
ncbi:halocyanin domain-containing protein [Halopenitus sp. POP-27]|uniref:halocyanin domain-containing protein n=1 Tax=Halopenitus sp. POP-27 TaxID=2994425 RepID=UPI002468DBCC|nr:halocyanin domain-containing protein [Halopenitus sp. POP-27]